MPNQAATCDVARIIDLNVPDMKHYTHAAILAHKMVVDPWLSSTELGSHLKATLCVTSFRACQRYVNGAKSFVFIRV